MTTAEIQALAEESQCFLCFGVSQAEALRLALIKRLVDKTPARVPGAADLFYGDYGGVAPPWTPGPDDHVMVYDTPIDQWWFWNGAAWEATP